MSQKRHCTTYDIVLIVIKLFALFVLLISSLFSPYLANKATKPHVAEIIPSVSPTASSTPIPTVPPTEERDYLVQTPTPNTIDCIGPDGKHLRITKQQCDDFNSAWKNDPMPTTADANSSYYTRRNQVYNNCLDKINSANPPQPTKDMSKQIQIMSDPNASPEVRAQAAAEVSMNNLKFGPEG